MNIILIIVLSAYMRVDYKKMKVEKELIEKYNDLKEKTIELNSSLKVYIDNYEEIKTIPVEQLARKVIKILIDKNNKDVI
jgi:hypothetical protein